MCQHHTTCRLDTEGHINQAAHAHNTIHHHSRNCIGRHTERHMNQTVVRAPNSIRQHEKQQHTQLHTGRHKRSRHLRPAQRAVEPSRFPAHICNVHKTSCILPFNHFTIPPAAQRKTHAAAHMPFLCSITATMHNPHKAQQKDTRHTERHMNQAVVRAPNSTQQHEKQQHTLAAYRKTQEEQALTHCTARRRAKSISSTHMQRAQNIMHFAIQPLRSPPQRNAKRTQQPTCHFCVPPPRPSTTHTKHSRKTLDTQKDTHEPSSSTRAQLDAATREITAHTSCI